MREAALAKRAMQTFVSKVFRDMCGVTTKDNWPGPGSPVRHNEITGEVYLNLHLLPVTDLHNQEVTSKVANRVLDEFQNKDVRPIALINSRDHCCISFNSEFDPPATLG
ncbi:hypothetical protein B0H14DRAFT_3485146 [Mycena olivaceomarginata]|nr:hypothetical protein B0H14DRAFT_3485146 [Mycena olivaceomarginata]